MSWTSLHIVSIYPAISEVNVTHHEADDNCRKKSAKGMALSALEEKQEGVLRAEEGGYSLLN